MKELLIALVGIVVGIALNEFVRRRTRIENYAGSVFQRRLPIYEGLHEHVQKCSEVAQEVVENEHLSKDDRHALVSAAVLDIAGYCDKHKLYLDEELIVHCTAALMGAEDVREIEDDSEREDEMARIREGFLQTKHMIRKEAGISDVDALFKSIIKPEHSSDLIAYYRQQLKEKKKRSNDEP